MNSHWQWLKGELDAWTAEGILSEEAAEAIRARCGRMRTFSWTGPLALCAAACLAAGAVFTAAGLWGALSQDQRFVLAMGPLVASLLAAALFLLGEGAFARPARRGEDGAAAPARQGFPLWLRESAGVFHGAAATAAVWMVHDSYMVDSDSSALFAVLALCLVVMLYLLRSAGLGMIAAADAAYAAWICPAGGWVDGAAWVLLAAAFPFLFFLIRERRERGGIAFAWGWIAAVLALTFFTASSALWQAVFFAIAASLTWLAGSALRDFGWVGAAFRFFGGMAVFAALLAASFGSSWRGADGGALLWVLLLLFLAADGALLLKAAARREWLSTAAGLTPFVMAAGALLALWDASGVSSAVLVSCFTAFLAAAVIARGYQTDREWQMGAGLLILLAGGGVRLVDSALTFGQRGAFFLTAGVVAAVLCALLRTPGTRRKRRDAEEGGGGDA